MDIANVMKNEIDAAVTWWSQQLQQPAKHDTGDITNNAFLFMAQRVLNLEPLSADQIHLFEEALRIIIVALIEASDVDFSDPIGGSSLRVVATDYGPEDMLSIAANSAHIDNQIFRFPMKTIMWINPGQVYVRLGYGAPSVIIYPASNE